MPTSVGPRRRRSLLQLIRGLWGNELFTGLSSKCGFLSFLLATRVGRLYITLIREAASRVRQALISPGSALSFRRVGRYDQRKNIGVGIGLRYILHLIMRDTHYDHDWSR